MKHQLFANTCVLMLSVALLSACEKMVVSEDVRSEIRPNVVLRVTQFEQTPFSPQTRAEVAYYCSRLCFHIYDKDGVRVNYVNQKQEDEQFGTASFSLEAGSYYLIVVGHNGSSNPSFNANQRVSISGSQMGDTFWCCEELEIGEDDVEKSLTLSRIASLLRFMPADDKPENMNQLIFNYTGSRGTFDGLTGYGSTSAKQTITLDLSGDESQYEFYRIPKAMRDTISVKVDSYFVEESGRVRALTSKTIEGVPMKRNCITICRGNLFDNKSTSHSVFITIAIDGEWDEDIYLDF